MSRRLASIDIAGLLRQVFSRCRTRALLGVFASVSAASGSAFAQTLETETARLLEPGQFMLGGAFEVQSASEGQEYALPLSIEYGLSKRWELLVEPVIYTAIRPRSGLNATGIGDVETTLTYWFSDETDSMPALAFAAEVKIPTANNTLIGTGQVDFAGYFIASKRFGDFDVHANFGYTLVGQPAGVSLDNIFNLALATEYRINSKYELFGEVLGTVSAGQGHETPDSGGGLIVPEAPTGELVGTFGFGNQVNKDLMLFCAASFDNNNAFQLRTGFTIRF